MYKTISKILLIAITILLVSCSGQKKITKTYYYIYKQATQEKTSPSTESLSLIGKAFDQIITTMNSGKVSIWEQVFVIRRNTQDHLKSNKSSPYYTNLILLNQHIHDMTSAILMNVPPEAP